MMITQADVRWWGESFPGLRLNAAYSILDGEMIFCAAYEQVTGTLRIGDDQATRDLDTFLCDTFTIKIALQTLDANGWP
jgi:hypothetical protein